MAYDKFQNESPLPAGKQVKKLSVDFLPKFFRTEANRKFLQGTMDQLIAPGVAEKLSGYIGRKTAKAYSPKDNYIGDFTEERENYQLEPAAVIKDNLDNVTFYKDYNDYINQLGVFGSNNKNHSRLNNQDTYAWNPNIDWDKFVNFREYYWLPNGPTSVAVRGQSKEVVSTYTVTLKDNTDNISYIFNDGLTSNPTIKLYKGQTYRFEIDTPGHPIAFSISRTFTPGSAVLTAGSEGLRGDGQFDGTLYGNNYDQGEYVVLPSSGSVTFEADENISTLYPTGITKYGEAGEVISVVYVDKGTIEFTVPENAPDRLYYISKNNIDTSGLIKIYDIAENSAINVTDEIIGKKNYTSANGVTLSNGMKLTFQGEVTPTKYDDSQWYVEGVGSQIKLINSKDLIIPAAYTESKLIPFDTDKFDELPFADAKAYATNKDYITVNRGSNDRNAWSRYNCWYHKDVILASETYNSLPTSLDETARAKRPIVEFEAGLKLNNFGVFAKDDVDLVDVFTKDVFSTIEGSSGYNIDGIDLAEGMRILFIADTDILVSGKIYKVKFITVNSKRQISLMEVADSIPQNLETVLVTQGEKYAGTSFHYNSTKWVQSQQKTANNQHPMFEVFDANANSFSDTTYYGSTTFIGSKIFSYKQGTGTNDSELGFPLSYRAITNSGDIVFNFDLLNDEFTYQTETEIFTQKIDAGYLKKYKSLTDFSYVNGFSSIPTSTRQMVIKQYDVTDIFNNNFEISAYKNAGNLNDLTAYVYVDDNLKFINTDYVIDRTNGFAKVIFNKNLTAGQYVTIKTNSLAEKIDGYYEFPHNLERNPLNEDITEFTLGETIDHVNSMIEDVQDFAGVFPGRSNLRDTGELDHFGKRFVKHSGPINLPLYHITNKNFNIVKALKYSKNEYSRFKRNFLDKAEKLGFDGPVKKHVDKILTELNKEKVKTEPFYFSDMLAYGDANKLEYTVLDTRTTTYPITDPFNLTSLSAKSIAVYLNGIQLTHNKDYTFNTDGYIEITCTKFVDDIIEIYEYESTDGSFVPATPTKTGLYPKYYPELTIDDSFIAKKPTGTGPFKVYGRTEQTTKSFKGKIGWFYPLYTSKEAAIAADSDSSNDTGSAHMHVFEGLSQVFYMPDTQMNHATNDDATIDEYPVGVAMIRGHDGSYVKAYKDYRDELLLDFERRIFNNIKVEYSTDLLDIHDFIGGEYRASEFTKNEVDSSLLSDFIQWLRSVNDDYTAHDFHDVNNSFTFNYSSAKTTQGNDLPGFWRGAYLHAYGTDRPNATPWEMLGFTMKPIWWEDTYGKAPYSGDNLVLWRDIEEGRIKKPGVAEVLSAKYARPGLTRHIPVDSQGRLKSPLDSGFAESFLSRQSTNGFKFGDVAPVENAWRRSSEFPFAALTAYLLNKPAKVMGLGFDVSRTKKNLVKQWVYSDTNKPIRIAEAKLPNTYKDDTRVLTCGLVNYIYNLVSSDVLTLYTDYKNNLLNLKNQIGFKIGGFSDTQKFNLILDSRSPTQQVDRDGVFVPQESFKIFTNTSSPLELAVYSGVAIEKAANGFIVRGYNNTSSSFEYYKPITGSSSINVTVGGISEETVNFRSNTPYAKGVVVQDNFDFYRVTKDFTSGEVFDTENLVKLVDLPIVGGKTAAFKQDFDLTTVHKLEYGKRLANSQEVIDFILGYNARLQEIGFSFNEVNQNTETVENWDNSCREFLFWTTQGWSSGTIITLSPAAEQVQFTKGFSVVDNLNDNFYDYSIFKADGQPLANEFYSFNRDGNSFALEAKNTDSGIYHVSLPLVQKEHVVLLENKTSFSDIIYEPKSGYRQDRIKVSGYRSDDWNGGLNLPGFIYDEANITDWTQWKDYKIGELVKYKQFYYVANTNIPGSKDFNSTFWYQLSKKPEPELRANLDYKAAQFTDFYDLDSDGFDNEQQKLAQHLIGYQKRQYLANIINDDISQFKFYRGYIADKGTMNALTKLFESLGDGTTSALDFYEEWAIQTGRYGATESVQQVEFNLQEDQFTEAPQPFELVNTLPETNFENVYRILPKDVYDKPLEYDHAPFPTKVISEKDEYIKTGGNVSEDDVQFVVGSISELSLGDVNTVSLGDYLWVTENDRDTWQVYQLIQTSARVTDATRRTDIVSTDGLTLIDLTLDRWADTIGDSVAPLVKTTDLVGVRGADEFNLTGIYAVNDEGINLNKVTVKTQASTPITDFTGQSFSLVKLRPVRVESLDLLNKSRYEVLEKQKVWVDSLDGDWGVIENNPVFKENQTMFNPSQFDSTSQQFGKVFTATQDNTSVFIGAPGDANGRIHYFRRTNEKNNLVLDNTLELESSEDLLDPSTAEFAKSISVSPDGEFLVVGMPGASNVKTKFKGEFDKAVTYAKGDIIKYRESLWKANREILPEISSQPFTTFDTYVNLAASADADSTTLQLLVAGDPGLSGNTTDHLLIRAPKDMYLGTSVGDTINLYWNTRSYAYPTLDNYVPFGGAITEITGNVITGSHIIQHKVDHILFVSTFVTLPTVGQVVTTTTGSATVCYVGTKADSAVVYLKDTNGIFSVSDELYIEEEIFVGFYTETSTYNTSTAVDGFWFINTGFQYSNAGTYYDTGRGLVYADVRLQSSARALNTYSNIQKAVGYIGAYVKNKNRASYITHLSYRGDPGGVEADQLSNKWIVRGDKEFTDTLTIGDTTEFRLYNLDNRVIDVVTPGFTYDIFNKQQTIVDLWDGYIDFTFDEFDFNGNVFEPVVGDIISDVQYPNDGQGGLAITTQTTSTAEVMFYRRNFNSVRVYVKALTGDWSKQNNIGKYSIQREANTTARGATDVARIMGTVADVENDIAVGTTTVGKLIVFEHSSQFNVSSNPEIIDEEYWFFNENTEQGISRLPNPPYSLNKDYKQVYHISAEATGTPGPGQEGAVAVFRRKPGGIYEKQYVFVSEHRKANRRFGKKVKIAQKGNYYTLAISSEGLGTRDDPGSIEFFRHGTKPTEQFQGSYQIRSYDPGDIVIFLDQYFICLKKTSADVQDITDTEYWENISWKYGKDPDYKGVWDNTYRYNKGSIVNYNNTLYKAKTNIADNAAWNATSWETLTDNIDYTGMLPNRTSNAFYGESIFDPIQNIDQFSQDFDLSADGDVLITTSKQVFTDSTRDIAVVVYRENGDKFQFSQKITNANTETGWGDKVALHPDGTRIAVSIPLLDQVKANQGAVIIYQQDTNGVFGTVVDQTLGITSPTQTLLPPQNEESEKYGYELNFGKDHLVVASLNGDQQIPTRFDTFEDLLPTTGVEGGSRYVLDINSTMKEVATTFDKSFTSFKNVKMDKGVVYVYETLGANLIQSETFTYPLTMTSFGEHLFTQDNHIYVGMPQQWGDDSTTIGDTRGAVVDFRKPSGDKAWKQIRRSVAPVDVDKIAGAFLYNKRNNQLITYVDFIDPVQGKVAGIAEQEIDYKVKYDPAFYNTGQLADNNVDPNRHWAEKYVGRVWWNINSARFAHAYQGTTNFQKNTWNTQIGDSAINIYEWVESPFLPETWDSLADTAPGLKRGISGVSLHGNTKYTTRLVYDQISKTFNNLYYFWVENKKTIPSVSHRSISLKNIAALVGDPAGQKYRYLSFLSKDKFMLTNCNDLIKNDDIVLNIKFTKDSIEKQRQNSHNQYQILTKGLETSVVNSDIEKKWFDSLVGFDLQQRAVPDTNVPVRSRYGVQNRPRQSMFVNRAEALKQTIERINVVCKQNLLADEYDLNELNKVEPLPTLLSGEYDHKVSTFEEISLISTSKITPAKLTPVVQNGKITNVIIDDTGRGYKFVPKLTLTGVGKDAEFEIEIDTLGKITSVKILNQGTGYDNNTRISVRRFTVLVEADSTVFNKWSMYGWNETEGVWFRRSIQDYDVTQFWSYIDWYEDGYNQFTEVDDIIDGSYLLTSLDNRIGEVVKITSVGTGGWLLLEKIADEDTEDYTVNYKTIGRQNGTVQFNDKLYDYSKNTVGFDNRSFDSYFYDNTPTTELRIIINAIKNNIFVGTLAIEYNELFFATIRYVLAEQAGADWVFKTSFVKAKHNLGPLYQDKTFNNNNLANYESYINEVKPYTTNVREFISNYSNIEPTNSTVSDFDLPPEYSKESKSIVPSKAQVIDGVIVSAPNSASVYPRKHWTENNGYQIKDIVISDPGSEYTYPPTIKFTSTVGSGATAKAYIAYGKITKIELTNAGSGYTVAPTVVIEGPQGETGTKAKATAILGNGVVRSPYIITKFDRVSGKVFYTALIENYYDTGTGIKTVYDLKWPMDLSSTKVKVYVGKDNDSLVEQLRSQYSYENIIDTTKSYTRQQGRVTFTTPPANNSVIKIEYYKPLSLLTAEDRINFAYNPTSEMYGKDLSQLMTGIDYGGVQVRSFEFDQASGWDSNGWYTDSWDTYDNTFEDQIFTSDGSTNAVILTSPLENGIMYNFYRNGIRIDDPNYDASTAITNPTAITNSIIGDGTTQVLDLEVMGVRLLDGDIFIVRKTTSDGSVLPDADSYDTALSGGDLAYKTATGIKSEDIIVDGDGFVTPTTSGGPEELVPGQVLDTVDIKVFTRDSNGQGQIYSQSYIMDSNTTYGLGVIPKTAPAIIVKVNNIILGDTEYTIDWNNNNVTIHTATPGAELNIIAMAQGVQKLLDFGQGVSVAGQSDYLTTVDWQKDTSVFVSVNGVATDVEIFNSEDSGAPIAKVGIRFKTPRAISGEKIHYSVFSDATKVNYSQVSKDSFTADGTTRAFDLATAPFYAKPNQHNIIVKVGNKILNPGYNIQHTVEDGNREYKIETYQQSVGANSASDVRVFVAGVEKFTPNEWRFDIANSQIVLSDETGLNGDTVEIFAITDGEYTITGNTVTLDTAPTENTKIEILQFSNHDLLGIERMNYDVVSRTLLLSEEVEQINDYARLTTGEIKLRKKAVDAQYVWVSVNGELLTPSVDYFVTDDQMKIQLVRTPNQNDVIDIIHFAEKVSTAKFAYRQFKDMLNRTHFKRLDKEATTLREPLNSYDLRIEVVDGSSLSEPSKGQNLPGILFIGNERIEYFVKEGNTLKQLRRGTLGTGVKDTYPVTQKVYDQNISKTVPYRDMTQSQSFNGNGTTSTFTLGFDVGTINEIEVFVAGKRLRKTTLESFSLTKDLDSPEGDVTLPKEFEFDQDSNSITLADIPLDKTKVTVVKKTGQTWTNAGEKLGDAENSIARFLRAGTSALPE
tara:strand:- start:10732 stop:26223 length:15492 start_codon:yes stop_codon:yes gene_type:complete